MTVFAVSVSGIFPILHLGRPWFFYWLVPYPDIMNVWPQWRSSLGMGLLRHPGLSDRLGSLLVRRHDSGFGEVAGSRADAARRARFYGLICSRMARGVPCSGPGSRP